MTLKQYQQKAKQTAKKFNDKEKEILTWGLGIAGEAGDVAGCIKKTVSHLNNQKDGIKENLGDTLWYITMICNYFDWSLEDIMKENIEKLQKRYPQGFTNKNAQKDKKKDWNE